MTEELNVKAILAAAVFYLSCACVARFLQVQCPGLVASLCQIKSGTQDVDASRGTEAFLLAKLEVKT